MGIRKRGSVWWIDFTTPSGERVRRSAETEDKSQAQELHDKLKAEAWRVTKLGDRPRRTWNDAVVRWLTEQSHKASLESDKIHLRWLDKHLNGLDLTAITRERLDRIAAAKMSEGVTPATVNRVMEVLRAILKKCADDWEWIDRAPKVRMLREPIRRVRFLLREEAHRLLTHLPVHLADMASFSLSTGLRRANVTGLRWDQVDMENRRAWVHPDQAKARKAIPVPLNDDAMKVIARQVGKHRELVFSFRGKQVTQVSTKAWYAGLQRAGIADFRWHDLRHTWASWHVQGGTPLFALQELGGWESAEMVRKYAHLAADHLTPWADRLAEHNVSGTNPAQRVK
ncbi:site-specific integrase [soil metagenome]